MLWTLDTCGYGPQQNCQVEVDSDFNFVEFVRMCPDHENSISPDAAGFDVVRNENSHGSSNAFDHLLKNVPANFVDTLEDGSKQFKKGINVSWAWTGTVPNRVLELTLSGITLTPQQRNTVNNVLNNRFGGKVVLAS